MTTHFTQPTLWRTCRVLANQTRLKMFDMLGQDPGLSVSAVAQRLKLPLPLCSLYLRALEARGLLTVQRMGRRVQYRQRIAPEADPAHGLITALRIRSQLNPHSDQRLFKLVTAFTHPRRIEVFRALKQEAKSLSQIQAATRISARALVRHLTKLETRGFVECHAGMYTAKYPQDAVGRELARLAAG